MAISAWHFFGMEENCNESTDNHGQQIFENMWKSNNTTHLDGLFEREGCLYLNKMIFEDFRQCPQ